MRFLDDVLVLIPTRWKLEAAVRTVNQTLESLGLAKASDKTFIGRIEKGLDLLGYHFPTTDLYIAPQTVSKSISRIHRLSEQQKSAPRGAVRPDEYVRRWL